MNGGQPQRLEQPGERVLDLDNFAPYYIRAIANRVAQAASRLYMRKYGIGLTEWSCLAPLGQEEEISATRICEMSGFDKGLVSRGLAKLEKKGVVESRPVENHNRKRLIYFTPAGRELYDEIRQLALQREERLLKGLTTDERAALMGYLRIMHCNALEMVADEAGEPETTLGET